MAERTVKAGEFKAKCLQIMDEVAATGEPVVITKRGRAVVRVQPVTAVNSKSSLFGFFANRVVSGPETTDYSVWTDEMHRQQDDDLKAIERAVPKSRRR